MESEADLHVVLNLEYKVAKCERKHHPLPIIKSDFAPKRVES